MSSKLRALKMQDMRPADGVGSFAWEVSRDDVKRVLYQTLLVAAAAAISYVSTEVVPQFQGMLVYLIPLVTAALDALSKWVRDTRTSVEQARVPDELYRQALKQKD